MLRRSITFFIMLLAFTPAAFAQDAAALAAKIEQLYVQDSFKAAYVHAADSVPENSPDSRLKSAAAEALASVSLREYDAKNFQNAYEGFRKSLKYDPTNARATQYFLRIRREMDVTKLRNEGPARPAAAPEQPKTAPEPAKATPEMPKTTAAVPAPAPALPPEEAVNLKELVRQLEQAGGRLSSMESSVAVTSAENQALRDQISQQVQLIQNLAAAPKPAAPAPAPARNSEESKIIAQTMGLLATMAEREAGAKAVAQPDPLVKELVTRLDVQNTSQRERDSLTWTLALGLIAALVLIVGSIVLLVVLSARSRARRAAQPAHGGLDSAGLPHAGTAGARFLPAGAAAAETPLLEFIGTENRPAGAPLESGAIQRDLLKAERLKRMYDEVKAGTLGWNTVRKYVGELEVSLRSEILAVVERKLEEGDILTPEAVLPVLFPFLNDYNDFIRTKAESLARQALIEYKNGNGRHGGNDGRDEDPLGLHNLMAVPERLKLLFRGQDTSLITAKLCRGIGNVLGMSTVECNLLYRSALAHDCGYLVLDQNRIQRTVAKQEISEEDFEFIKTHTVKGLEYFGELELPAEFKQAILHHHERNDGSGYPSGLKKTDIPRFAKIIGVAETFAALISKRTYREKRDIQHALAIISDAARSKFDPEIVKALDKVAPSMGEL